MEKTTQWRYTPPTHVVAAFRAALEQFKAEGGQPARRALRGNCEALIEGMDALGFRTFLARDPGADHLHVPCAGRPRYDVQAFYARCASAAHPLSGQAHAGRDLPRRLHRRDRPQRDEERRHRRSSADARRHGNPRSVAPSIALGCLNAAGRPTHGPGPMRLPRPERGYGRAGPAAVSGR